MRGALVILGLTALLAGCGGAPEVTGPPCPLITDAQAAQLGFAPTEETTIGAVTVRRQYGQAVCAESSGGVRCDLTIPGLTAVVANGRTTWFQIPPGQPATVTSTRDGARCVYGPRAA